MSCNSGIGVWATGLWTDLGSPTNISALTISGYVATPNTLGKLNSLIGTCYAPSGYTGFGSFNYDVTPDLAETELALIGKLYMVSYYNSLVQSVMGAGGVMPTLSAREGDTSFNLVNPVSMGKVWADMAKEANEELKYLVNAYINQSQGANVPRSVVFPNVVPGYGGYGYGPNAGYRVW